LVVPPGIALKLLSGSGLSPWVGVFVCAPAGKLLLDMGVDEVVLEQSPGRTPSRRRTGLLLSAQANASASKGWLVSNGAGFPGRPSAGRKNSRSRND
jgi:hypothetical protein